MTHRYLLRLRPAVQVHCEGGDLVVAGVDLPGMRSRQPGPGIVTLLDGLVQGGQSAEQLIECALAADPRTDVSRFYYLLSSLENKGFLTYSVAFENHSLVTLEPISRSFCFAALAHSGALRLSRFACLRREATKIVVESPLGHARVVLHDPCFCALLALLAAPRTREALAAALPGIVPQVLDATMALLVNAGVVFPCDGEGRIFEETDEALRQWEFHDLLFHTRSRAGRHDYPLGGTCRFENELSHARAVKPPMSEVRVVLYRPTSATVGPSFFEVLEARRTRREHGESPITVHVLGEFLWRSARVQTHVAADMEYPGSCEVTLRPYPSGGAMHELELYLTVTRCAGLEPGFYHYDPMAHELERLADLEEVHRKLAIDAMNASGLNQPPDVLITLAARFGRVAWKYEGVAYALVQKDVGGLYQQMYLVATALGLAPCGLGTGNSDIFAQATGMDYFAETSVGDFMLSSATDLKCAV